MEKIKFDLNLFLGAAEYIICDDESKLDDYDYVHRCYKFDKDVELRLIPLSQLKRPLLRTGITKVTLKKC